MSRIVRLSLQEMGAMRPGTWQPSKDKHSRLWWCCPSCGLLDRLADRHQITADGQVTPDVACHAGACDFQATVQLEGWAG